MWTPPLELDTLDNSNPIRIRFDHMIPIRHFTGCCHGYCSESFPQPYEAHPSPLSINLSRSNSFPLNENQHQSKCEVSCGNLGLTELSDLSWLLYPSPVSTIYSGCWRVTTCFHYARPADKEDGGNHRDTITCYVWQNSFSSLKLPLIKKDPCLF